MLSNQEKINWFKRFAIPSLRKHEPDNAKTLSQLVSAGDLSAAESMWRENSDNTLYQK